MIAPSTKSVAVQPTPAVIKNNGALQTKAHASFSGATYLNAAQKGTGAPTVAVVRRNRV